MKRRLISVLLAALILIGLMPAGVVAVSAASSMTTSNEAIAVLKEWEGFLEFAKWDNGQYTIGFGTGCDPDDYPNGISRAQAEALLREYLVVFETEINEFADRNGLTLNQNQFDALVLFSFNVGTGWTSGSTGIRDAIVTGATGNELIFHLTRWCLVSGSISTGLITRRLAEADIYLNGYYAKKAPDCFTYVLYNGNGGSYTYNVQGYDATQPVEVKSSAVYAGYRFLGWYTAKEGGRWITTLDSTTKELTLYAHWQSDEGNVDEEGNILGTAACYERAVTVNQDVHDAPSADADAFMTVSAGDTVLITADYVDASGVKWGELEDGGWIALTDTGAVVAADEAPDRSNSVTLGSGSTEEEDKDTEDFRVTVTVTSSAVNFRSGPGASYTKLGTLSCGQQLVITEITDVAGVLWGRFSYGWICLTYTDYESTIQGGDDQVIATGVVTTSGALRIRSEPSTKGTIVGKLASGTTVNIYEIKTVGDMQWGRISSGWICLTYVNYKMVGSGGDAGNDNTGTDSQPDYTGPVTGVVTASALCIRSGAGTNYNKVGTLYKGQEVIVKQQTQVNGVYWGQIDEGWICMTYVRVTGVAPETGDPDTGDDTPGTEETPGEGGVPGTGENPDGEETPGEDTTPGDEETPGTEETDDVVTGMVTASNLCVRSGPGTGYAIVTSLPRGTTVSVLQQKLVNGVVWGQIENGWICMSYVNITSGESTVIYTGMITASSLRIRSAAGTGNAIVGSYIKGTVVEILEVATVNGTLWGRTDKGWISMDYVK